MLARTLTDKVLDFEREGERDEYQKSSIQTERGRPISDDKPVLKTSSKSGSVGNRTVRKVLHFSAPWPSRESESSEHNGVKRLHEEGLGLDFESPLKVHFEPTFPRAVKFEPTSFFFMRVSGLEGIEKARKG